MKVKEEKIKQQQADLEAREKEFVGGVGYRFHDEDKKHLHTLNDKPLLGTSTIAGVLAKPLTWWASGLACEHLGWTNSKKREGNKYIQIPLEDRVSHAEPFLKEIKGMTTEDYLKKLDEAYKAHAQKLDKSAEAGTDLHAELENYVKDKIAKIDKPLDFYPKLIHDFIMWAEQNVEEFIASEAHTYSERLWVGGIVDCALKLKDGKVGIMDFKSAKESYDSHFLQIAGYDIQITENGTHDRFGNKKWQPENKFDFYAVVPFGSPKFTVDMRYNTEELKNGFEAMVTLYKITNK